jgi:hypothetical protein
VTVLLAWAPLLREWFLSFGIVAMRPVILDPIAGVAYLSLWFDWCGRPRPQRRKSWSDLIPIVGTGHRMVVPYTASARIVRIVPVWVARRSATLPHACHR